MNEVGGHNARKWPHVYWRDKLNEYREGEK